MKRPPDGIDRDARFRRRMAEVERAERRRTRRRRAGVIGGVTAGLVVAAVGGHLLYGAAGVVVGIGVVGAALMTVAAVRRFAERRGASAWDWQTGRHRLFGDPSRKVQERDEPR